jgi:hypothetical protein
MGCIAVNLAVLEVIYLARFWTEAVTKPSFTCGCLRLHENGGEIRQNWLTMAVAADSLALWLFNEPFPVALDFEDSRSEEDKTVTSIRTELDSVTTSLGTFNDCLKVVRKTVREGSATSEIAWLAHGIGLVRIRRDYAEGSCREIDLTAHLIMGGDGYFPRAPGNQWHFESRNEHLPKQEILVRRELWRLLADPDSGQVWLVNGVFQDRRDE